MNKLKILAVCGFGVGSSMILNGRRGGVKGKSN